MLEDKAQAQQTLDEMWAEHLIPFQLMAHELERGEPGCYTVHFRDVRIPSLFIYWDPKKGSFESALRAVVNNTVGQRSRAKGGWSNLQLH
jgi:hypothetical protein